MEFCRTQNIKKPMVFLEFHSIPKKHMVFKGFLPKFQKNLVFFFLGIFQNSKKNLEFSKIPKFQQKLSTCPNIFGILEFWKPRGFFLEFCRIPKKTKVFKVFYQNVKKNLGFPKFHKNFKTRLIFPNIFEFWNFGKLEVFLEL